MPIRRRFEKTINIIYFDHTDPIWFDKYDPQVDSFQEIFNQIHIDLEFHENM